MHPDLSRNVKSSVLHLRHQVRYDGYCADFYKTLAAGLVTDFYAEFYENLTFVSFADTRLKMDEPTRSL